MSILKATPGNRRIVTAAVLAVAASACILLGMLAADYRSRDAVNAGAPVPRSVSWPDPVDLPVVSDDPPVVVPCPVIETQVFLDENLDGLRNDDEHGLSDHLVRAFDTGDVLVASGRTDADGLLALDVSAAESSVRIEFAEVVDPLGPAPLGVDSTGRVSFPRARDCRSSYASHTANESGEDSSEVVPLIHPRVNGDTSAVGASGDQANTVGLEEVLLLEERLLIAANVDPIELGDRIWLDVNGDGRQDPGEPGLAGVVVHIVDADGRQEDLAVTDQRGRYTFRELLPHSRYFIEVDARTLPEGWAASPSDVGDDGGDSDAVPTGETLGLEIVTGWVGVSGHDFDIGITVPS